MAKLKMPLLSGGASGKFGKKLVYSMRNNISQSRSFHYPKKAPSGEQLAQRYIIGLLTARWQTMTDEEKAPYIAGAVASEKKNGKPLTGFNYWIKTAMSDLPTHYGMIAFYPMNEGSGRLVKDYSGNDLHITLFPVTPSNSAMWANAENKKFGKCIANDATTRYGVLTNNNKWDWTTKFFFGCWVMKGANDGSERYYFYRGLYCYVGKNATDQMSFTLNINGTNRNIVVASAEMKVGKWYWVSGYYDANGGSLNFRLYLNGKRRTWTTWTGNAVPSVSVGYFMSRSTTLYCMNGAVDNLLFLKRIPSDAEQLKIYNLMAVDKERQNLP